MKNKDRIIPKLKGNFSSQTITGGHTGQSRAYDPMDERMCVLSNGSIKNYHFCSAIKTEYGKDSMIDLIYLGIGKIHSIDGGKYMSSDRNDELHFWRMANIDYSVLNS